MMLPKNLWSMSHNVAAVRYCASMSLILSRPDESVRDAVGNDGLTAAERAEYAERYNAGVGRKRISKTEKEAYLRRLAERARS